MNALSEALQGARRIVFFGGAGVSVPSGIPDFRGENGLYAKEYDGLTAEMLLSHSFFCLHPDIFYDFYKTVDKHSKICGCSRYRYDYLRGSESSPCN